MTRRTRRRRLGYGAARVRAVRARAPARRGGARARLARGGRRRGDGFERQRAELLAMLGPASDALDRRRDQRDERRREPELVRRGGRSGGGALTTRLATLVRGPRGPEQRSRSWALGRSRGSRASSRRSARTRGRCRRISPRPPRRSRTNVADTAAVAANLRTLAIQLDALEASLGAPDGGSLGSATAALNAARIVLVGLLAWLAVPAVLATWLGWRLTRRARSLEFGVDKARRINAY